MKKIKIGFICVHNSCRSQIAEAVAKINFQHKDNFEFYSAGTHKKDNINQDAVQLMKQQYEVDMELSQRPKTLDEIPELDVAITMGCNVQCPQLPCQFREDWGLDDPSGKDMFEFLKTLNTIEMKLDLLIERIENKEIIIK